MGLGDEEDEEEEPFDLDSDEEEEPAEVMGLEEEDDEEEEGEEGPQSVRQRIPGLRLAQGLRAKRRARVDRRRGASGATPCALARYRVGPAPTARPSARSRGAPGTTAHTNDCGRRPQGTQAGPRARNRSRPRTAPNPFTQAGSGRSEAPRVRVNRLTSTQRVAPGL